MGRPSNTEERRRQITAALVRVMARRGYAGASVAAIAKAARLAPGLVHYHFKSKEEVLLADLADLVARHEARVEARLAEAGGDPLAAAHALLDLHLAVGRDADPEGLAAWILLSGEALRDARVRAGYARALAGTARRFEELIRGGVAMRAFTCRAPAAAAAALVALIQGYFVLAATAGELIPRGSAAGEAKRALRGLLGPGAGEVSEET